MEAIEIHQDLKGLKTLTEVGGVFEQDYSKAIYNQKVMDVVKELETRGGTIYNTEIVDKIKPLFQGMSDDNLGYIVYSTRCVMRNLKLKADVDNYLKTVNDYLTLKDIDLDKAIPNKTYYTVYSFNREPFKARFIIDADSVLFLMKPRHSRKGFIVNNLYEMRLELI